MNFFAFKVCKRADEVGNRKAALEFGVDESNIRAWIKKGPILSHLNKMQKALREKDAKWTDLELALRQWIIDKRSEKARVTTTSVRLVKLL